MISKRAKEEQFGVEKFFFSFGLKTLNSDGKKGPSLFFLSFFVSQNLEQN